MNWGHVLSITAKFVRVRNRPFLQPQIQERPFFSSSISCLFLYKTLSQESFVMEKNFLNQFEID